MRIIKFRAKTIYKSQWVYGYFVKHANGNCYIDEGNGITFLVQEETVGQLAYTTNNGVQIYEGDFVNISDDRRNPPLLYEVKWDKISFICESIDNRCICYRVDFADIVVVGNKWDDVKNKSINN